MQNQVKNIYFFDAGYGVRGSSNYILCLIDYLIDKTDISVGLIDFEDGYIKEHLQNKNIKFINYTDSEWDIEPNSVIFCSTDRLCLLKPLKNKNYIDKIKVVTVVWETEIS